MQGPDVGTQSGILVIAQNPRHAAASVYAENCPYRTGHRGMSKLRQVYEIETYQLYELKPGSWTWAPCKCVLALSYSAVSSLFYEKSDARHFICTSRCMSVASRASSEITIATPTQN